MSTPLLQLITHLTYPPMMAVLYTKLCAASSVTKRSWDTRKEEAQSDNNYCPLGN